MKRGSNDFTPFVDSSGMVQKSTIFFARCDLSWKRFDVFEVLPMVSNREQV